MKRYNVVIVGYKDYDLEKVKELLRFEENYLEREFPKNRNILINRYVFFKEAPEDVINDCRNRDFIEFNLDNDDIGATKHDDMTVFNIKVTI